jgi:hypothetical protein
MRAQEGLTHIVTDFKTFAPHCSFTAQRPHEPDWYGHDFTDDPVNATCLYCKTGQKHPNAASMS